MWARLMSVTGMYFDPALCTTILFQSEIAVVQFLACLTGLRFVPKSKKERTHVGASQTV